jgi:5-methylcytosine-specific restriction endonuclease McrA
MGRGRPRRDLVTYQWRTRTRKTVLDRDGHECQIRGPRCEGVATEVDHIVPHVFGGDSALDNLRAACKPCNAAAGSRARGQGVSLTGHRHPSPPMHPSLPTGPRGAVTRGVWHVEPPA